MSMILTLPSVGVKEGLSCVIFHAIVARKTPNLALPSLQHSVYPDTFTNRMSILYLEQLTLHLWTLQVSWIYIYRALRQEMERN